MTRSKILVDCCNKLRISTYRRFRPSLNAIKKEIISTDLCDERWYSNNNVQMYVPVISVRLMPIIP